MHVPCVNEEYLIMNNKSKRRDILLMSSLPWNDKCDTIVSFI